MNDLTSLTIATAREGLRKKEFSAVELTESIGIKPVSKEGSERLIRAALRYAVENNRRNVTLVHKGNIQKYTEGMFMKWGYALAKREFVGQERCRVGRLRRPAAGRQDADQGRHHRRVPAADPDPARRVRRHPVLQPDGRSPVRRAGRAGRRHRHRPRRQHQLRDRATRCSRPRTARRPSTPARTRSTPAR